VLPLLYLHGLSSKDFGPALEGFLGTSAGLSAPTITRLTAGWQDEARTFSQRDLSEVDFVYLWADGVHVKLASTRRNCACWYSSACAPTECDRLEAEAERIGGLLLPGRSWNAWPRPAWAPVGPGAASWVRQLDAALISGINPNSLWRHSTR
jgi:hypothetical protein